MLRNSAAETFYGGFTASKIRRLIRRAVIFSGGFSADKYSAAIFGDRRRLRGLVNIVSSLETNWTIPVNPQQIALMQLEGYS